MLDEIVWTGRQKCKNSYTSIGLEEAMTDSDDEREARAAARKAAGSRPGSTASQDLAQIHLADKKEQLQVLKNIQDRSGEKALRGTVADGIKDVERDIDSIEKQT